MNRRELNDLLGTLNSVGAPHREAMKPHKQVLDQLQAAADIAIEAFGKGEIMATCEVCGLPFFEDDDYATSEDGVSTCLKMAQTEDGGEWPNAVCFDPDRE